MNRTSVRRRRPFATTKTQVDLDFAFILSISAIYSTPLPFLTSVIWTITDTTIISTWLPPNRKTCPELSPWSPAFLRLRQIRFLLAISAPIMSLPFLESCLPWIRNTTRRSRRRRTMLCSSCTRTLLRCSKCLSILLSRLSGNLMTLSLLTHYFSSAKALPSICVRCYLNFLAKLSCSLVVSSSRRPQAYWSLILPALASLPRLNPSRRWLLLGSTI